MVYPLGNLLNSINNLLVKKIEGLENLPKDTSFVIASNHNGWVDPFVLGKVIKNRKLYFIATMSFLWNFMANLPFSEIGGTVRINMLDKKNVLEPALKKLKKGHIIGIFPEGIPNKEPGLRKGKTGVARLILKGKVPVVPIGIQGTLYKWYNLKMTTKPKKRVIIKIGKPLYFDKYYGKDNDYAVLKKVTKVIMKKIASLIGQKYLF